MWGEDLKVLWDTQHEKHKQRKNNTPPPKKKTPKLLLFKLERTESTQYKEHIGVRFKCEKHRSWSVVKM